MKQKTWKEAFPKERRPEIMDLELFMNPEIYCLFRNFAEYILQEFDLRFGIPVWTEKQGWVYRIGKSGVYLITGIQIERSRFVVEHIEVANLEQSCLLIEHVKKIYQSNKDDFDAKISEKTGDKVKEILEELLGNKKELAELQRKIVPDKYNVFRWPAKLDIHKLNKLYIQDAKGIQDEILVDEIGLTLYLRCLYGKEDMKRMERNIIRCHGCEAELIGNDDFRQCSCGRQYSYKEYRRSFRKK